MGKAINFLGKHIWLLIIILSIPACWALFVPGYFGASDDLHIAWLFEFHKTLSMGKIPPRFVPDLSFNFGYPLFNYVFPLPFYISEVFHILGLNLVDSIKTLFLLTIPISGFFMYLFLREFTNKGLSLVGAILYIYTPYRATDLYVRGAIGEVLGFVFLPLLSLAVVKLSMDEVSKKWVGIGSIAFSFLILTHNITAYMFIPFIFLLWFLRVLFLQKGRKIAVLSFVATVTLGLLISSFFWVPALLESSLVKYDTVFNFVDHFPTLIQLVKPYFGYGASVPGPYDGMSFFLGYVNVALLIMGIPALIFFKFPKNQKILLVWSLLCIIFAVFLMNFRSSFIWSHLPLLPYFQFPWRFLILTTFAIPIFVIILEKLKHEKLISTILICIIIISVGSFFRPQDFLGRTDVYFLNRYIPNPIASDEYFKTQEEYLRLPTETKMRPDKNYPLVIVDKGEIVKINKLNDLDALITVSSKEGMTLSYNKYNFPGWVAKIDGVSAKISTGSPYGQINLMVPRGEHIVDISFQETNFKRLLDAISLVSFLVSLWLVKNLWLRSRKIGLSF